MAIGIVSLAVLVIIGTLPIGLKSMQNAETLQATSNIANQLRGQLQLLSFSTNTATGANTVAQLANSVLYYTTDGTSTTASSGSAYYTAEFSVSGISMATAPTASNISFNTNNVRNVVVSLLYPPGVLNQTNTFSLLVARQTDN